MITKYSQLYLSAATKEQINSVAKKLGKTPEEILNLISEADISGKKTYGVWLLKQLAFNNIILPEDAERVKRTLRDFEQLNNRNQLKYKNINQYPKIHDLEADIRSVKGDNLSEAFSFDVQKYLQLPGVEVYGQNSEWLILKVSNAESLTKTSDSTEWCTLGLQWATKYITEDGAQYVVFKKENSKLIKYAQFSPNFEQFKDIHDEEIMNLPESLYDLAVSKLKENTNLAKRNVDKIYSYLEKNPVIEVNLDLRGTQITSLPAGLSVGGSLVLQGTQITSLPTGLSVGGDLYLQGTPIASLPEGLSVGGSLVLQGTPITSLPADLKVGGGLYLYGTPITSLPEGLSVGRSLDISETQITSLPKDLKVGGYLYGEHPITGESWQDIYNKMKTKKTSSLRKLNIKQNC